MEKAAPAIKQKLRDALAPLKERQANLHGAREVIESTKTEIDKQGVSVVAKIEQSFHEFQEIVDQCKQELTEKATQFVKDKFGRLNVQEKDIVTAADTIQGLVDFVEENIENATEEELIAAHLQLLDRIDEEIKKKQLSSTDLDPMEEADIVVKVACEEELRKLCLDRFSVFCLPVDPAIVYSTRRGHQKCRGQQVI